MAEKDTPVEETTETTATTTEAPAEEVQETSPLEAAHQNLEDEGREPENSQTTNDTADFDPIEHGKQTAATNVGETPGA